MCTIVNMIKEQRLYMLVSKKVMKKCKKSACFSAKTRLSIATVAEAF